MVLRHNRIGPSKPVIPAVPNTAANRLSHLAGIESQVTKTVDSPLIYF